MRDSRATALILGALAATGQAPFGFWPGTLAGFALFFWLVAGLGPRALALRAWLFGTGYFLVALHWIFEPFLVDAARHAWMAPFAVVLLAGGLALFWGLAGWVAGRVGGGGPVALAVALALAEMARGYVLTGFPWALPGHALADTGARHVAALVGSYGLTALLLLVAALAARAALAFGWRLAAPVALGIAGAAALVVPLATAGLTAPPAPADAPVLRLVQPNAPQREKWDPDRAQAFFDRHIRLSAAGPAPDMILWSETALPMLLNHAEIAFEIMADAAPGVPYLLGIQRRDDDWRYYNSAVLMRDGVAGAIYDKHHLVPFGEYMPLQALADRLGLQGLAAVMGSGYTAGPGPGLIDLGFAKALPLICYEAVFARHFRDVARPDVLIQLTNDAWFGQFSGPYQHLAQARMRATEFGLPMLRVANTGVSAVIDARGVVLAQLALGTEGALDAALPPALPPTLYARMGDAPVALVLGLALAALGLANFRLTGPGAARKRA